MEIFSGILTVYFNCKYFLIYTSEQLGWLLGISPSGRNPCGGNYPLLTRYSGSIIFISLECYIKYTFVGKKSTQVPSWQSYSISGNRKMILPFKAQLTEVKGSFHTFFIESGLYILDLPAMQRIFLMRSTGDYTYVVLWVFHDSFFCSPISFFAIKVLFRKTYPSRISSWDTDPSSPSNFSVLRSEARMWLIIAIRKCKFCMNIWAKRIKMVLLEYMHIMIKRFGTL